MVTAEDNDYVVDSDNLLDPFVGTWIYQNGPITFKIVLKKVINNFNDFYYEDLLYGEYQYTDGQIQINTLGQLNQHPKKINNSIAGNEILLNNSRHLTCTTCEPNEKRVRLMIDDPLKDTAGYLYLKRTTVGSQPALSIFIFFNGLRSIDIPGEVASQTEYAGTSFPQGYLTFIKE